MALRHTIGSHGMVAYGLIDRDRRSDQEIASLQKEGVYTLPVAEADSLLLLPCVIKTAAEHNHKNGQEVLKEVSDAVLKEFDNDKERQTVDFARHEVHYQMSRFDKKVKNRDTFESEVKNFMDQINPKEIFESNLQMLNNAVANSDFDRVLLYFNRKRLINQVSELTGHSPKNFQEWLTRHLLSKSGENLLAELKKTLPEIPTDNAQIENSGISDVQQLSEKSSLNSVRCQSAKAGSR